MGRHWKSLGYAIAVAWLIAIIMSWVSHAGKRADSTADRPTPSSMPSMATEDQAQLFQSAGSAAPSSAPSTGTQTLSPPPFSQPIPAPPSQPAATPSSQSAPASSSESTAPGASSTSAASPYSSTGSTWSQQQSSTDLVRQPEEEVAAPDTAAP